MDTPIKGFLKFFSVRFDGSDFGNPEYSAHLSSGIQILNAMTNRCPRADRLRSGMHSPASLMTAAYACRTMPPNASYGRRTGRKNWTFAGSDEGGRRADDIYSLIATAKLNDIDPQAWLADVALGGMIGQAREDQFQGRSSVDHRQNLAQSGAKYRGESCAAMP
jgi:hypothetical protein